MEEVRSWLVAESLENLVPVFEGHKINSMRRLLGLNEDLIRELIPDIGDRVEFLQCYHELKQLGEPKKGPESSAFVSFVTQDCPDKNDSALKTASLRQSLENTKKNDAELITLQRSPSPLPSTSSGVQDLEPKPSKRRKLQVDFNEKSQPLVNQTVASSFVEELSSDLSEEESLTPNKIKSKVSTATTVKRPNKHLASFKSLENLRNLDLKNYLKEYSFTSEAALDNYELNGTLTESDRSAISDAVANFMLRNNYLPSTTEYQEASKKICEIFSAETEDVYFVAPDGTRKTLSGKLPNRVKNIKFLLKKKDAGRFPTNFVKDCDQLNSKNKNNSVAKKLTGSTDKNDPEIKAAILSLQHESRDNWPLILRNWSITHSLRYNLLKTGPKDLNAKAQSTSGDDLNEENDGGDESLVHSYYKEWTVLALPNAYLLLNQDFSELYPGKDDGLIANWNSHKDLIVQLIEKERSKSDNYCAKLLKEYRAAPEDKRDVILFHLLPNLLSKRTRGSKGSTDVATATEARKSFILHVLIPGDINRDLRNHRVLLQNLGLTLQPILIVVGPTLSNISASYVQIDSIRYQLRTPIKALDTCFKAFFALDAAYPTNSKAIWLFIQRYFYDLRLKEDENIAQVTAVVSSLKGLFQKTTAKEQ